MRIVAFTVLAVSLVAQAATGKDIYVNNVSGDDSFTGGQTQNLGSGDGPLRTIAAALRTANNADHIILAETGIHFSPAVSAAFAGIEKEMDHICQHLEDE